MMNEQQRQIDRMVDGELSVEQQRGFLAECEEHARWRELALAYVESQTLTTEIRMWDRDILAQRTGSVGRDTDGDAVTSSWNPMYLAAAIVLSLSVGYGLGLWWQGPLPSRSIVADSRGRSSEATQISNGSSMASSSVPFTVSNPSTNELQQIDLPIVNVSDLGPDWRQRLRPNLPDDLLREMRAGGLNVRQTRTVTPIRLRDGRRVFVPIDYYFEQPYQ